MEGWGQEEVSALREDKEGTEGMCCGATEIAFQSQMRRKQGDVKREGKKDMKEKKRLTCRAAGGACPPSPGAGHAGLCSPLPAL